MKMLSYVTLAILFSIVDSASAAELAVVYHSAAEVRNGNHWDALNVDFDSEEYPAKVMDMLRAMPKLQVLVVGGPRYADSELEGFSKIPTLRSLVLDSTNVTDVAVERMNRVRPDVSIYRGQIWALTQLGRLKHDCSIDWKIPKRYDAGEVRALRKLLGDRYFEEATRIDFRQDDIETSGVQDRVLSEELAPLKYLTTLVSLDLSDCNVDRAAMTYLNHLTKIEDLTIQLGNVAAEDLTNLSEMSELRSLSAEPISDDGLRHLSDCKKLVFLNVGGRLLTDKGLASLSNCSELKTVYFTDTRIRGDGLKHFARNARLESLQIKDSSLDDLSQVPRIPALKNFMVTTAPLRDATLIHLAKCRGLEGLWLRDTQISDAGLLSIRGLTSIRDIRLDTTKIGDAGLLALKEMVNLRHLDISATRVSNHGLALLQKFPNLESVTAYNLPLNDEGVTNLNVLKKVRNLSIDYNIPSGVDAAVRP